MRALIKWFLALLMLAISAVLLGFYSGNCNTASDYNKALIETE